MNHVICVKYVTFWLLLNQAFMTNYDHPNVRSKKEKVYKHFKISQKFVLKMYIVPNTFNENRIVSNILSTNFCKK